MPGLISGEIDYDGAIATLLPHQREFITAKEPYVALCGGVGSGKTMALCLAALYYGSNEPNGFSLIGRLNIPSLKLSTLKTFLELCPSEWVRSHQASDDTITLTNGHTFVFRHLEIDSDTRKHFMSMNLSNVFIDEATEISEETYLLLLSRLRRKTTKVHRLRMATNPNGQDWLWRHYFSPGRDAKKLATHRGLIAPTLDNIHLPKDYVENLLAIYPADWASRYIYGNFNEFSHLIWKDFNERTHSWKPDAPHDVFGGLADPPAQWPVIVGIDIGGNDPWAVAVASVAPDGRLYVVGEVYGSTLLVSEVAGRLKPLLDGRTVEGVAYDYANRQAALELAEHGIYGSPAIKEVIPGLLKVAEYMKVDDRLVHPFDPSIKGSPRIFFSSRCHEGIRELSSYKWKRDRSGTLLNEPSHENSHFPDAVRYLVHTFRPDPAETIVPKKWENPELNEISRQFWKDSDKGERGRPQVWQKPFRKVGAEAHRAMLERRARKISSRHTFLRRPW